MYGSPAALQLRAQLYHSEPRQQRQQPRRRPIWRGVRRHSLANLAGTSELPVTEHIQPHVLRLLSCHTRALELLLSPILPAQAS